MKTYSRFVLLFVLALILVSWGDAAKDKFKDLDGKTITVTGKLADYKSKPEIVVTNIGDLIVN